MKSALIIPTLNAGKRWEQVLDALDAQTLRPERKILLDSGSDDQTVPLARQYGFEVHSFRRENFNAGRTRQYGADLCPEADVLIYMTQDAVPATPDSILTLLECFETPQIAAAYGRQLPRSEACAIEQFTRHYLYPAQSYIKTKTDIPDCGLQAAFCSNSFAAYRRSLFMHIGGFPATAFGEDMLVAGRLLLAGCSIAYCAEACVIHSHPATLRENFMRGIQIGRLHRDCSWLQSKFGSAKRSGKGFIKEGLQVLLKGSPKSIPFFLFQCIVKFFGFTLGKNKLPCLFSKKD